MKGYTTRQQIENYLLTTIDASFYTQINDWITQMEKYVEQKTNRVFVADTIESARLYDGDGSSEMLIDECISVSEITIDGGTPLVVTTEYMLYPANSTPKNKIKLLSDRFIKGNQNISVKAKWGYSVAVPDDIKFAVTVLVSGIINYSGDMEGEVKSMSIGSYSVTYKDEKQWQDFERIADILKANKKMGVF